MSKAKYHFFNYNNKFIEYQFTLMEKYWKTRIYTQININ